MSSTKTFWCEGCGIHVLASFNHPKGDITGLCGICLWLNEYMTVEAMMEYRRTHGYWFEWEEAEEYHRWMREQKRTSDYT